jgi:hypothetical protein
VSAVLDKSTVWLCNFSAALFKFVLKLVTISTFLTLCFGHILIPHCLFLKTFCESIYKRTLERAKIIRESGIKFELTYFIRRMGQRGLDSSASGCGQIWGSSEQGNELWGSIKCGEYLH